MKGLTDRQKEVLEFLNDYIDKHSFPPTIRETAKAFSISVKGAYDHLKALEKKGAIKLQENCSRAIEIVSRTENQDSIVEVPILGSVAAGKPIFADENWAGSVKIPAEFARHGTFFALKVRGDSMKDVGIFGGDFAIVEQRQTAENGDIVVALIDDSVTLKRFFKETNRVRLQAENQDYAPIFSQNVRILGKLRVILRSY
jgi:repressor LexA